MLASFGKAIVVCVLLVATFVCCAQAGIYTITDIGDLGQFGSLTAINNNGWVVGNHMGSCVSCAHIDESHLGAFVWDPDNGRRQLESPSGNRSSASDINDSGQISGSYATDITLTIDFGGFDATLHVWRAIVWDPEEGIKELGAQREFGSSHATGINNAGEVVGTETDLRAIAVWPSESYGFRWDVQDGLTRGGYLLGLNNAGDTISLSLLEVGGARSFFSNKDDPGSEWIESLGGDGTNARDLNDVGQVVGSSMTGAKDPLTGYPVWHAFVWDAISGTGDLGTLGGVGSSAQAINIHGDIVGSSRNSANQPRAVLWKEGNILDLNELVLGDSIWDELIVATGINDRGQIIGAGLIDGETHGFLLTPVPEPSTCGLSLMCLFVAILVNGKRRSRCCDCKLRLVETLCPATCRRTQLQMNATEIG